MGITYTPKYHPKLLTENKEQMTNNN